MAVQTVFVNNGVDCNSVVNFFSKKICSEKWKTNLLIEVPFENYINILNFHHELLMTYANMMVRKLV